MLVKNVPVDAISATTFTVNALNGTAPTNTDAHTYVGNATTALSPTFVDYDASLGIMKLEQLIMDFLMVTLSNLLQIH